MSDIRTIDIDCELLNCEVSKLLKSGEIIDLTESVSKVFHYERRIFVHRKAMEFYSSEDQAGDTVVQFCTNISVIMFGDMIRYAQANNGLLNKSQFFISTHVKDQPWLVVSILWNEETEESVSVWGFPEDMKAAGLITDEVDGKLN